MPASSNFQEAIREAQSSALVGPNVVNKALPYVGGGMVLTAAGVLGGMSTMARHGTSLQWAVDDCDYSLVHSVLRCTECRQKRQ